MNKFERNARIKKHDSDIYVKISNQNCSTPPPPPPFGDEEGWNLQFCKWWGWNWVRKEQNYVTKMDRELLFGARPLREQNMKNMQKIRGAGDVPLHNPKHDKNRYFKHIRNLFVKLKHASSLKKFFNTPSTNHHCYCAICNCDMKEKKFAPLPNNNKCYLEDRRRVKSWSKGEVDDSSGSTSIGLCHSLKEMNFSKRKQNDLLVTKTDSFQQTQETKKTKKKRYYHLVCSSCYPQICCCRCHKQTNSEDVQHPFSPIKSHPKDSWRKSKYPYSMNKPSEYKEPKRISELPPGDYNYRCHEDSSNTRPHFLNQWKPQIFQVTPLKIHRCTKNKEHTSYGEINGQRNCCRHGSHLLYSGHRDNSKCRENQYDIFTSQMIPEKESADCFEVKTKQDNKFSRHRRQYPLPELSESSYSDNVSQKHYSSQYQLTSDRKSAPDKGHYLGMNNQLEREEHEKTLNSEQTRLEEKNYRSSQKPRRRLRCNSFPGSSKHKDSPNSLSMPSPFQDRKLLNSTKNLPKQQTCNRNQYVREYPTYQKQLPCVNILKSEPSLFTTKTVHPKRTSCHVRSYNSPDVPCKKPKVCDTPEKEYPHSIYRDWNRVTFGKKMIPKFDSQKQQYPQIQNTRSDILDRHYSLKVEEEFFSPVTGKIYNISPRTVLDPEYYTSAPLPDPIDMDDDLEYLESLEASFKVDRSSRIMLDAVCDAILSSNNNQYETTESTLIRKFSYPDTDEAIICNSKFDETLHQYPPKSRISEIAFMEKVEALVRSILNSKLTQSENVKSGHAESSPINREKSPVLSEHRKTYRLEEIKTDSQQSTGNSILEQFNDFNNLFEKMDAATKQNKDNVEKINGAIQSLPEIKEDIFRLKNSTDQQFSVSLLEPIASTSNKEEARKPPDMLEQRQFTQNNDVFETRTKKNENAVESFTSGVNRIENFNQLPRQSFGTPQQISSIIFKNVSDVPINSKIPVSQQILSNSHSVPISRIMRRAFKNRDVIKYRKLKTRIPIRKKTQM